MQLRPATATDQPWLRALYASTREQELGLSGWDGAGREAFVEMQFRAQNQAYRSRHPAALQQIIECEGHGAVGRLWTDDTAPGELYLLDISLLPRWQRQGLGTRCLQQLLARAGRRRLRLHVAADNPARRLYERLGLAVVGGPGLYLEMTWRPPPGPDTVALEICDEQA